LKSLFVIKFGIEPIWTWKMKDMGYLYACSLGAITCAILMKAGIAKLKEQTTKAIILKNTINVPPAAPSSAATQSK